MNRLSMDKVNRLAQGTDLKPYSVFEVLKPMNIKVGEVADCFNEPGRGIQ